MYYVSTKGKHPFRTTTHRPINMLNGKPEGLNEALKDLLSWISNLRPEDRPSAKEAMKYPLIMSNNKKFEMLCKVGNCQTIKINDTHSSVVQQLNCDSSDSKRQMGSDVYDYLVNGKIYSYELSRTECLGLIQNVGQHWYDQPWPRPQPERFYKNGDRKVYFLETFHNVPV